MIGNADIKILVDLLTDPADKAWSQFEGKVNDSNRRLGQAGLAMSAGIAGGLGYALKVASDFETSMAGVQAMGGIVGKDFDKLRKQAIQLGIETKFSANESAQAMQELAQGGMNAQQVYDAMPGTLALAAAGQLDLAEAANTTIVGLNGFGLAADQSRHVADVLAKGAASGATSVKDLGTGMGYVASVAKASNVSLETTVAMMSKLSDAGMQGSKSGTALRAVLDRMLAPTEEATKLWEKYGITIDDGAGSIRNVVDVLDDVKKSGMTTSDIMRIFGSEAGTAVLALTSKTDDIRAMATQFKGLDGEAEKMAGTLNKGLGAQVDALKGSFEALAIAIGDTGLLASVTQLVTLLAGAVGKIAQLPPPILKVITIAAIGLAVVPPLVAGITSIISTIGMVQGGLIALGGFLSGGWAASVVGTITGLGLLASKFLVLPGLILAAGLVWGKVAAIIYTNRATIIDMVVSMCNVIRAKWSELGSWMRIIDWSAIGRGIMDTLLKGISFAIPGMGYLLDLLINNGEAKFINWSWWGVGQRLVSSLIGGLRSMIPSLSAQMDGLTSMMDRFLPHSPAKEGALSKLGEVGGGLISEIISGVQKHKPQLQSALSDIQLSIPSLSNAGNVAGNFQRAGAAIGGRVQQAIGGQAMTVNITIQGNADSKAIQQLRSELRNFHNLMKEANFKYGSA